MSEKHEIPIAEILTRDVYDRPTIDELHRRALSSLKDRRAMEQYAASLAEEPGEAAQARRGVLLAALGRYADAAAALKGAKNSDPTRLVLGQCYRALGRCDQAMQVFKDQNPDGWTQFDIDMEIVTTALEMGQVDEALEVLNRNSRRGQNQAEFHFRMGCALRSAGQVEAAAAAFHAALDLDEHPEAAFHLGCLADQYDDSDLARDCYRRALSGASLYVSALLNLGILHEDRNEYEAAIDCYTRALRLDPTNQRAILFLKDAEASQTMYIDEELERRADRRNQILETPVTDFELSVRSRNCLQKMGVRTLGDLARCTEAELLSYKNFGETSLKEIKSILSSKGLHLGMGREGEGRTGPDDEVLAADAALLSRSVDELGLSVRSRNCFDRLQIRTVGELIQCTEAELLACRNFGQTSLAEIKAKLADLGLSLKET